MDYERFYSKLFQPIENEFGPIDPETIFAIVGFDFGGPLNFCTAGKIKDKFVTYVSCELAVRKEQIPSSHGRFELMCHCNDEKWVRKVLTTIGQMSLESRFDHLHTIDLSPILSKRAKLQGAVLERFASVKIKEHEYSILRVLGVTTDELESAREKGKEFLLKHLKEKGVYPITDIKRASTL